MTRVTSTVSMPNRVELSLHDHSTSVAHVIHCSQHDLQVNSNYPTETQPFKKRIPSLRECRS